MNHRHHVLMGAVAGLGAAAAQGLPAWQCAASAGLGSLAGPLPDVDNHRWWKRLDRFVPDEWLGYGGPLQHRGLTHWWVLPAAAWIAAQRLEPGAWWLLALVVGWASHLVGDLVFGQADRYCHRGPGVPLGPWFWHVGVGLKSGGPGESLIAPLVAVLAVAWAAITLTDSWPLVDQFTSAL